MQLNSSKKQRGFPYQFPGKLIDLNQRSPGVPFCLVGPLLYIDSLVHQTCCHGSTSEPERGTNVVPMLIWHVTRTMCFSGVAKWRPCQCCYFTCQFELIHCQHWHIWHNSQLIHWQLTTRNRYSFMTLLFGHVVRQLVVIVLPAAFDAIHSETFDTLWQARFFGSQTRHQRNSKRLISLW